MAHHHDHRHTCDRGVGQIPVTILTGFLGSGKTTLLNHILLESHGRKIAVIENEFGAVSIDDALLQKNAKVQVDEDLLEMVNGCICCKVRTDLIDVLQKMAKRVYAGEIQLDGVVIETTGLADPAPIAQTFFVDRKVASSFKLDGVVTLVDAKHIEQHLDEEKPEGVENQAIDQVAFSDRILLNKVDLVTDEDLQRIEARLVEINKFAPIVRTQQSKVSADSVLKIGGFDLQRNLDAHPGFLDDYKVPSHDKRVTSFGIMEPGDLDLDMCHQWLSRLCQEEGENIFRMKGVVSIAHSEFKWVFHAVHMLVQAEFTERWDEDDDDMGRGSKLIFIGKNLDEAKITRDFQACKATKENLNRKIANLRFTVGDKVECMTGPCTGEWSKGTIVALLYRQPNFGPGVVAPYQIRLDNGRLIFAPSDDEQIIRAQAVEEWPVGTRVQLQGLAAAPEYNGRQGTVIVPMDWHDGRVEVRLDGDGEERRLKPANLGLAMDEVPR